MKRTQFFMSFDCLGKRTWLLCFSNRYCIEIFRVCPDEYQVSFYDELTRSKEYLELHYDTLTKAKTAAWNYCQLNT